MSEIRGAWVPESAAEDELLMDLHEVTREAYNNGVPVADIVAGMNYLSAAISLYGDDNGFIRAAEQAQAEPSRRENCPTCEQGIADVQVLMGGEATVKPCGCNVTIHQVPGWVDLPGDANGN